MSILVTGVAGFLGLHVTEALLDRGDVVVGVDDREGSGTPYLDDARRRRLDGRPGLRLVDGSITDRVTVVAVAEAEGDGLTAVVHLVDQGGGRWPEDPGRLLAGRALRHLAVLDLCAERLPGLAHLVYVGIDDERSGRDGGAAAPDRMPSVEALLSRAVARCHGLAQSGLLLPWTFGPWGQPDETCYILADAIAADRTIGVPDPDIEGRGPLYVDDAVAAILTTLDRPPAGETPHRIWEPCAAEAAGVGRIVGAIERALGRAARRGPPIAAPGPADVRPPPPAGDLDWRPAVPLDDAVARFVAWHGEWHASVDPDPQDLLAAAD